MPNINFYVKDDLYFLYVKLDEEKKKELKKAWRQMVKNASRTKAVV